MTRMPCHITDQHVAGDPADQPDEDRCRACGDSLQGRIDDDYCPACQQEQIDEAIKARRLEAMLSIARGLEDAQ